MTIALSPLVFEPAKIMQLYRAGETTKICDEYIALMKQLEKQLYITADAKQLKEFNDRASTILYLFVQNDFIIPPAYARAFVTTSHLLANLISMSAYETADGALCHLLSMENNFVKLLVLYSCYTKPIINPDQLFGAEPQLASMWWQNYQTAPAGSLSEEMHKSMTMQLKKPPTNFILSNIMTAPLYFQCIYYTEGSEEKPIKEMFNREIKRLAKAQRPIKNYAEKHKIAIVSGRWQPTTAVYKSLYPLVEALKDKYDLTLIHFGENEDQIDGGLFNRIKKVSVSKDLMTMDLRQIELNGYQLAFFTDIGMNAESVYLSNVRFAPIMATGYGHPVSTFGSEIDYFIGGAEVEDASLAEYNYSERLVLIPGIGATPVNPKYERKCVEKDTFTINCCWTAAKINYPMLKLLREVIDEADRDVRVAFFPSWTVSRYNNAIPLQKYLSRVLDHRTTVHLDKKYHEYLELLEKGSITLDSYPFGGYNTVVDSMFVGVPVVSIEGGQFYNRAAAALNRRLGLDNLITHDIESCKTKLLELINDSELLTKKTEALDDVAHLEKVLLDSPEPKGFSRAIDYLIDNHDELKAQDSNEPIVIT